MIRPLRALAALLLLAGLATPARSDGPKQEAPFQAKRNGLAVLSPTFRPSLKNSTFAMPSAPPATTCAAKLTLSGNATVAFSAGAVSQMPRDRFVEARALSPRSKLTSVLLTVV